MNPLLSLCWAVPLLLGFGEVAYGFEISGLTPDRRPSGAPEIVAVVKSPEWYQVALTGIEPPYPYNFRFLEDQGNWYTPFNHPGMTGRYDIRGWHHHGSENQ